MQDRIAKLSSILSYILFGLSLVFGAIFYFSVMSADPIPETITIPLEKTKFMMEQLGSSLNNFILIVYLLLGIAVVSTLFFSIRNIFKSKDTAIRSLISVGVLGVIILISYGIASPAIPHFTSSEIHISAGGSRIVGTGLFTMYIFFIAAILGAVFTEVRSSFK